MLIIILACLWEFFSSPAVGPEYLEWKGQPILTRQSLQSPCSPTITVGRAVEMPADFCQRPSKSQEQSSLTLSPAERLPFPMELEFPLEAER